MQRRKQVKLHKTNDDVWRKMKKQIKNKFKEARKALEKKIKRGGGWKGFGERLFSGRDPISRWDYPTRRKLTWIGCASLSKRYKKVKYE